MNFKLSKIALALPISLVTLGAFAAISPDDIPKIEQNAVQQNTKLKAINKQSTGRYFVLLKDEPIALYQGNVKGFKATNVAASNGINANSKGKLDLHSSASVLYGDYLALKKNHVISNIQSTLSRNISVHKRFKIAINSIVMNLELNEVLALRKMPGVLAVEKEEMHQLLTDVGPQHVGAPAVWDNTDIEGAKGEGLIVGVLDTGIASFTTQVSTWQGESGFEGKEFHPSFADVGDDGFDHQNPNGEGVYFGDCVDSSYWCNDKVIGVVSFEGAGVTSVWDMRIDTGQDDHGHGTHVASTIAGNRVDNVNYPTVYPSTEQSWKHKYYDSEISVSISGVAPHANIVAYKTCTRNNGCSPSLAVESIEHAIENNIDVINYSVGGPAGSPWFTADALAFLAAREAGIFVAVAAGNSGASGEKTIGSPGNSPWVTTVAALSHSRDFTAEKVATFSGGNSDLGDLIGKGATSGIESLTDVVYAGDIENSTEAETAGGVGYCGDYSLPSSWDEASIEGKVVICRRGGNDADGNPLTRLSKGATALYAKAAGMILINADEPFNNVENDLHVLPTIHLNMTDGDELLAWLAEGEGHQVSFTGSELELNNDKADITATFTSRGPDYFSNDYLVPDVGAPGVEILAAGIGDYMHPSDLSAQEQIGGDYRFMSGTSMASPHIAGMYILMKAAHPQWTAAEAQSALMMTAYTDVKEDDDFDGELSRADIHRTGAGSARVNLAINAGLVLNETRNGYLAANPHAEELGLTDSIEDWHGQPHQMNMPSLSKGECLIECDWTRTFKATKAGSWTVSFEFYNEGFTLSADNNQFTLSEGEEIDVTFTAIASQGLDVKWANGRVVLTPSDSSTPILTLPVAVNFIAGVTPEKADVVAKRTSDSFPVSGITSIGTDDLQIVKSGIAKADIHEFELMRDPSNNTLFHWDNPEDPSLQLIPLNIQADTKRLVIEVLETSSPDIDIYVGIDSNLDGRPDVGEMSLIPYMSATDTVFEVIDELNPRNDTYWILVHNWAEGPALLEDYQMVCEDGEEAPEGMECVTEAPVIDTVKLAVTNVAYDDDSMMIDVPSSVEPLEEIDARIVWDAAMTEGDIYYGVFSLGTSAELDTNIGTVKVNMLRGNDDVVISEPTVVNDKMSLSIDVSANSTSEAREYSFSMELAEAVAVDLIVKETSISGVSMQMSVSEDSAVDYTINDNVVSWVQTQASDASGISFSIILDTSEINGTVDATPMIESMVNTSDKAEYSSPNTPVFIEGRPVFSASTSVSTVKEGEPVTLSATVVDSVIDNPQLSYQWTQTSGPSASIMGTGQSVTFKAPEVSSDQTLTFSLVGSNGAKASAAENVSVNVESKSSGGSTNIAFLILSSLGLLLRRRRNK
jgi:subtilisin family serine protease